jgi:flagellar biosynthesis protein FlhB
MSFSELKRESKEQDGDPQARGRRRTLHRDFVRGAIVNVKKAAFVVVNPTHVAVALDYRPPEVPVPCVLVRAEGAGALRVRRLAAEHGVPVIEDVALARALYFESRAGDVIPHAHYVAVAAVVSALMRTGDLPEAR